MFRENSNISPSKVRDELENLFKAEVFFVPDIKEDMTGHIDGHLRFVDEKTIVVNQLKNEFKYWQKGFLKMVKAANLNYIEMPYYEDKNDTEGISAIGSYLNFLQLKNLIIFPIFEERSELDQKALRTITEVFPNSEIVPININPIAKKGGLMNCITWSYL